MMELLRHNSLPICRRVNMMRVFKAWGSSRSRFGRLRPETGIPARQDVAELAVEERSPYLQKVVRPGLRPAHLLALVHAVVDQSIDRRLDGRSGDALAGAMPGAVADGLVLVRQQVQPELVHVAQILLKPIAVAVSVQGGNGLDAIAHCAKQLAAEIDVAVPEVVPDAFEFALLHAGIFPVVLGTAQTHPERPSNRLQPHGDMEPVQHMARGPRKPL